MFQEEIIQGLELARRFYSECAFPLFQEKLPEVFEHTAFGLVGEGSECFGFDDALSRDHDWGPAFCLWLPERDRPIWEERLEAVLALLPSTFLGFKTRMSSERRIGRVGIWGIETFYARFIGLPHPPQSWRHWRAIPETYLAVCTNGSVFSDTPGTFSAFRKILLDFYPEDIRLKKVAARCMGMAQAGQYNLPRSLKRGESATAMLAAARFAEQALSMVFLLNRRYMPFYKWAARAVRELPILGTIAYDQVTRLSELHWPAGPKIAEEATEIVEVLCSAVADSLRSFGLSEVQDNWLLEHGPQVQAQIQLPELRALPVLMD